MNCPKAVIGDLLISVLMSCNYCFLFCFVSFRVCYHVHSVLQLLHMRPILLYVGIYLTQAWMRLCVRSGNPILQLQAIPWFLGPRLNKSPLRWPSYRARVTRIKSEVAVPLIQGRGICGNCQRESEARARRRGGGSMLIEENHVGVLHTSEQPL